RRRTCGCPACMRRSAASRSPAPHGRRCLDGGWHSPPSSSCRWSRPAPSAPRAERGGTPGQPISVPASNWESAMSAGGLRALQPPLGTGETARPTRVQTMNSFGAKSTLNVGERSYEIFRLDALQSSYDVARLPFSLKVLLENLLRREDGESVRPQDIEALARWD